jgi:hypothetical protein
MKHMAGDQVKGLYARLIVPGAIQRQWFQRLLWFTAVIFLFAAVGKQVYAGCFYYCEQEDHQQMISMCPYASGCPGNCVRETWQEGHCRFTINPFAGCNSVTRDLVYNRYKSSGCTPNGLTGTCTCNEPWIYDGFYLAPGPDCDGYVCE